MMTPWNQMKRKTNRTKEEETMTTTKVKIEMNQGLPVIISAPQIIGTMWDHNAQALVFECPKELEECDLILLITYPNQKVYSHNLGRERQFILTNALTGVKSWTLQVAFVKGEEFRLGTNGISVSLRSAPTQGEIAGEHIGDVAVLVTGAVVSAELGTEGYRFRNLAGDVIFTLPVGQLPKAMATQLKLTPEDTEDTHAALYIQSSDAGGLNTYDSTARIQLESYQKAQKTNPSGEAAHYGEVLRIDLKHPQAKGAIAIRDAFHRPEENPRTIFWMAGHGEANDSTAQAPNWHNHTSFEIPDEGGMLQTVMEFPFAPFNEPHAYGLPLEEMYVRSIQKLIAAGYGLYVEGLEGDRTVKFCTGRFGTDASRRFAMGIDGTEESGGQAGSNFRISRYNDDGSFRDTVIFAKRANGYVGIGTTSPERILDINGDRIRLRTARTIVSSASTGQTGDICWDENYLYLCVSANKWRRIPLAEEAW